MAVVHILAPFINANGGDWRAIDMYLELRHSHEVYLWSQQTPHRNLADYPIQEIKPYKGNSPAYGTLYISGSATAVGHWYDQTIFDRIILIHNLCDQEVFYRNMHRLTLGGKRHVEIQYASKMVKDSIGLEGEIAYPTPNPERFKPVSRLQKTANSVFTVGRISSDRISKHHFQDIALYRQLANQGIRVQVIGGTCLMPWLSGEQMIDLLPGIEQSEVPAFLALLDCFYYRVSSHMKEAFGIVVAEAMAVGLPVVCYDEGGYTEIVSGYEKGFLFKTNQEALETINTIRSNRN